MGMLAGGKEEIRDWRLEIGDWGLEIGDWRLEIEVVSRKMHS
jgi:hypothetical protein